MTSRKDTRSPVNPYPGSRRPGPGRPQQVPRPTRPSPPRSIATTALLAPTFEELSPEHERQATRALSELLARTIHESHGGLVVEALRTTSH
jgi:hypothetical protein